MTVLRIQLICGASDEVIWTQFFTRYRRIEAAHVFGRHGPFRIGLARNKRDCLVGGTHQQRTGSDELDSTRSRE
jgi:hypothetical protein